MSGEYAVLSELTQVCFICCFSLIFLGYQQMKTMREETVLRNPDFSQLTSPTLVPAVELLLRWEALLNVCVRVCACVRVC